MSNQNNTTESTRINKCLLRKIKLIANSKRQTISGYIELNLQKQVDKDWNKLTLSNPNILNVDNIEQKDNTEHHSPNMG